MARTFLFYYVILLLTPNIHQGQNIEGNWQGIVYQPNGAFTFYFSNSMRLRQINDSIVGESITSLQNTQGFALHNISGTLADNVFTFKSTLELQVPFPGGAWCAPFGALIYDPVTETLSGSYGAGSCLTGVVKLTRLKVLSDTAFCPETIARISVSGQDVKWYSTDSMTNLIATGNTFTTKVTSSTAVYLTQTHNNTESPPIALNIIMKARSFLGFTAEICEDEKFEGYNKTGIYLDTFRAENGCDSIRSLDLIVHSKKTSSIQASICDNTSFEGYARSGIYVDTFRSITGCDSVRTLTLTVLKPTTSSYNVTICSGGSYFGHNVSGLYRDKYRGSNGCDSTRTVNLKVLEKVKVDLGPDRSICRGDSLRISPGRYMQYLWQDGSTKNEIIIRQSGLYRVTVTDFCGSATGSVIITEKNCDLVFPNAFSPNGDGINDLFRALKTNLLQSFQLFIYDRTGNRIFQASELGKSWDGRANGQLCSSGTYVWYCRYSKNGITRHLKGTVTLVR